MARYWMRFAWLCFKADMFCLVHFSYQRWVFTTTDGRRIVIAVSGDGENVHHFGEASP